MSKHSLAWQWRSIQRLEGERDEAFKLLTQYAREAGEAKGRLEMSEAAGIVDGWRERTETAEQALSASQKEVERAAVLISALIVAWADEGNHGGDADDHDCPDCAVIRDAQDWLIARRSALQTGGKEHG